MAAKDNTTTPLSNGVISSSMFNTPQAVDDTQSFTEDQLSSATSPFLIDVMSNDGGGNATFPRLLPAGSGGNNYVASSLWIRSASYFRIKNVNLGYRIPEALLSKLKISTARIFVSAANIFTVTDSFEGFDPEINTQNAEFYPLMKTFTAGINVNF